MIALLLLAQAVTIPHAAVAQYGIGTQPCATAMTDTTGARASWVLGFWTGLNAAFGRSVGRAGDARVLVDDIDRRCAANPSHTLGEVTLATYLQASAQDR